MLSCAVMVRDSNHRRDAPDRRRGGGGGGSIGVTVADTSDGIHGARSDVLSRQAKTTAARARLITPNIASHRPSHVWISYRLTIVRLAGSVFLSGGPFLLGGGVGGGWGARLSPRAEWDSGCGPCHPIDLPLYSSPSGVYALNLVCCQGPSLIIDPSVSGGETNADWFQRDRESELESERERERAL